MRNLLSLLLAIGILLSSALFGYFYINISSNTQFERSDNAEAATED